jgi:hypothetical protein
MSYPLGHSARMKLNKLSWFKQAEGETIAAFGSARLMRNLDGRYTLVGGTPAERAAAHDWCSLFAPQVVFPGPPRRAATAPVCKIVG